MAGIVELIPMALQVLGGIFGFGQAQSAQNNANRRSAKEDEVLDEYLKEYRASAPFKQAARVAGSARAASRPFYWKRWGGPKEPPAYISPPPPPQA